MVRKILDALYRACEGAALFLIVAVLLMPPMDLLGAGDVMFKVVILSLVLGAFVGSLTLILALAWGIWRWTQRRSKRSLSE